jgi:phage-related protein
MPETPNHAVARRDPSDYARDTKGMHHRAGRSCIRSGSDRRSVCPCADCGNFYSIGFYIGYDIIVSTDLGLDARKPLVWLGGQIKTPPFSKEARVEAGSLLRRLQEREFLSLPQSRPMPDIGARCHELRVRDENRNWRVVYRIDTDAIVVAGVFPKTTRRTSKRDIDACKARLARYDNDAQSTERGTRG